MRQDRTLFTTFLDEEESSNNAYEGMGIIAKRSEVKRRGGRDHE